MLFKCPQCGNETNSLELIRKEETSTEIFWNDNNLDDGFEYGKEEVVDCDSSYVQCSCGHILILSSGKYVSNMEELQQKKVIEITKLIVEMLDKLISKIQNDNPDKVLNELDGEATTGIDIDYNLNLLSFAGVGVDDTESREAISNYFKEKLIKEYGPSEFLDEMCEKYYTFCNV